MQGQLHVKVSHDKQHFSIGLWAPAPCSTKRPINVENWLLVTKEAVEFEKHPKNYRSCYKEFIEFIVRQSHTEI